MEVNEKHTTYKRQPPLDKLWHSLSMFDPFKESTKWK